jgi:SAM-dependent methyltransferase
MFMEHLFAQGIACIGLDFSKESLEVLEKKHNGNPLFGGAIHVTGLPTPVKTGSADVVFFLETIEHLLPEHFQPTLVEIARIVRPSGYVIVTTPHNEDLSKDMVYCPDCGGVFHRWQHVSSFTVESLTRLMSSHGFTKVICKPTLFCEYSTPMRSLLITAQKILGKPLPNLLYIGTKIDS